MLAVYEAAKTAVARARAGQGPTLLELMTYRITGHSRRDPCLYQAEKERRRSPGKRTHRAIRQTSAESANRRSIALDRIVAEVDEEIEAAVEAAMAAPEPKPEDTLQDLFVEP